MNVVLKISIMHKLCLIFWGTKMKMTIKKHYYSPATDAFISKVKKKYGQTYLESLVGKETQIEHIYQVSRATYIVTIAFGDEHTTCVRSILIKYYKRAGIIADTYYSKEV
jgi:hypothetical protein